MQKFKLTGTTPDGKAGTVWGCGKCMLVAANEEAASQCCDWKCRECGAQCSSYHTQCDTCRSAEWARRDQERLDKATKLESWDGCVFWNDQFYSSLEEAIEAMDDCEERPEWIYVAKPSPPRELDPERILQDVSEDMGEDAYDWIEGKEEFAAACEAFNNANANISWFEEDRTRAVRVPPEAKE